jgi:hypothetical protein
MYDLGASVSVMPTFVYYKLTHTTLEPTSMCLQLADQSVRYLLGITKNILVNKRDFFMPMDFVVLDMHPNSRMSLILGRPFLSTTNATLMLGKDLSNSPSTVKKSSSHSSQNKSSTLLQRWYIKTSQKNHQSHSL